MEEKKDVVGKKSILDWYDSKRNNIISVFIGIAGVLCFLFATGVVANVDGGFIIGKFGMPEFDGMYKTYIYEIVRKSNVIDTGVALVCLLLFFNVKTPVEDKENYGVWIYNAAILAQVAFVGKHLAFSLLLFGTLPYLVIFYGAVIFFGIFVFVLNILHYRKNKGSYVEATGYVPNLLFFLSLIALAVWISVSGSMRVKADVRNMEDNYAAREYRLTYAILHENGESLINENYRAYVGLKYVSLFNESGREYTPDEMDEAIYNLAFYGGDTHYAGKSWNTIVLFNDDLEAIEEKYDFIQYSYNDDDYVDYDVFRRLVTRRLNCLGQSVAYTGAVTNFEEIDAACQYVHDMLVTGKPMEEIGSFGEEIVVEFPREIKAGTKGFYDMELNCENAYVTIERWDKVSYVGSDAQIDKFFGSSNDEFIFEDGCVYKAIIKVYPEITYYFNDYMTVSLEGADYNEINSDVYDYQIDMEVWISIGEEITLENAQVIDAVEISGVEGVKVGDDIVLAEDKSLIGLNDNLVCNGFNWGYYKISSYAQGGGYYTDCYPEADESYSVKNFDIGIPMFQMTLRIYADTGYKFGEDIVVKYNGTELMSEDDFYLSEVPSVEILGYYKEEISDYISVKINYYRIRFEGEHGTIVANYDFAPKGTVITLTPIPDEGYKFVGYETSHDLTKLPNDPKINITNNQFVMKDYPVVITGIFEEE